MFIPIANFSQTNDIFIPKGKQIANMALTDGTVSN